ncbi:hypothetical protein [Arthrobacter sp. D5-1]|uniref:hypothetical protein n=1 Tax=Arthrobacter sp. D5-1 TaxID=1477518 RepID=UPI001A98E374|nr:hypothetical protein [Arthrobacter sp. D5-1]QSZ49584.1 hypothetical protein AYX22_15025 [Arthrobacter sp. D5-1]
MTECTPAAGNPCQECPFRKSNAGREHTSGNYDDQFIADWRGIANGGFFACHIFAPDIHLHDESTKAMGYVTPIETGARPECAGSTLAIARELEIAATYSSHNEYIQARPTGLSQTALKTLSSRIKGETGPEFITPESFDSDLIRDPATDVDVTSPYWVFGIAGVERMFNVLGEPPTYEAMHRASSLRLADGTDTTVDTRIRPLLAAMSNAGIQTISSCQNFREVIDARFPERLPFLVGPDPEEFQVHYKTAMETAGAYVRFQINTTAAQQFLSASKQREAVAAQQSGDVAQIDFPLTDLLPLTEIAATNRRTT